MGKIITLDEGTIGKIAAGEVVERPASVVKELVENSIDAGASRINVEIKNGGISLIRVTDNGSGIEEDDVAIAFERHSTSKIRHADDITSVQSLGFRGEALASIAAVSHVEMVTRTENRLYATQICLKGGKIEYIKKTGAPVGTSVTVKDLFFNTPARYKFLKKDTTESGYVSDIIYRLALANPGIMFRLSSNGTTVVHSPGDNDLLNTIVSLYGIDIGKSVIEVDYKDELVKIAGYAGKPEISKSNRNFQSVFVNGRYIRSKIVTSAIDEAYKTYLMKNRHAFIVLKIEINPAAIDVNVHPAKMEIKFSDEQAIYRAIYHAVNGALMRGSGIRDASIGMINRSLSEYEIPENRRNIKEEYYSEAIERADNIDNKNNNTNTAGRNISLNDSQDRQIALDIKYDKHDTPACTTPLVNKDEMRGQVIKDAAPEKNISIDLMGARIAGKVFSTYILLQKEDYILIIDQHAAHERILYEEIRRKYYNNQSLAQMLVVPVVVNLTHQEMQKLKENERLFNGLGFIFEDFGNNSIIIRAVPYGGYDGGEKELFIQLLDTVDITEGNDYNDVADEALYSIACKAAVKANMNLDDIEIMELVKKLSQLENPYTCPHGRPTIIKLHKHDFEKLFKRRL